MGKDWARSTHPVDLRHAPISETNGPTQPSCPLDLPSAELDADRQPLPRSLVSRAPVPRATYPSLPLPFSTAKDVATLRPTPRPRCNEPPYDRLSLSSVLRSTDHVRAAASMCACVRCMAPPRAPAPNAAAANARLRGIFGYRYTVHLYSIHNNS